VPFRPGGSIAIVTGAAGGIGAALVRALGAAGAAVVVASDLDGDHIGRVAAKLDAETDQSTVVPWALDVSDRAATGALVDAVEGTYGPIDLWCANAGIATASGVGADPALWQRTWEVNVLGQVNAAAELLPRWRARGGGHLLVTASAAGLLTNLGDAPYSVTKHAAVALAEWVAITHGHEGVAVTCLCPQGVRTPMVFGDEADEFAGLRSGDTATASSDKAPDCPEHDSPEHDSLDHDSAMAVQVVRGQGIIEPAEAAECALEALIQGRFLALPHPEVARYETHRATDHDRWITGMRKLQAQLDGRTLDGTP
jgi:NAD(P)-dependent dehydrogenase (short-subunit alcohol dehydrogenase family)